MKKKLNSLKYCAPLVQLALCPITILFLWSVFTGPEVIPVVNEELVRQRRIQKKQINALTDFQALQIYFPIVNLLYKFVLDMTGRMTWKQGTGFPLIDNGYE